MITEIYMPESLQSQYILSNDNKIIDGFNKVNIFIGPNNSGKSRFMRNLFGSHFDYQISEVDFKQILNVTDEILKETHAAIEKAGIADISGMNITGVKVTIQQIRDKVLHAKLPSQWTILKELKDFVDRLKIFQNGGVVHLPNVISTSGNYDELVRKIRQIGNTHGVSLESMMPSTDLPAFKKVYIPILRGLRPLQLTGKGGQFEENIDNYKKRTVRDYFSSDKSNLNILDSDESLEIFTGLTLYYDVKRMLLGSLKQREKIRQFELFLSQTFFHSKTVTLTPNIDEDCLYITIGEEDRPIYDLGDGIQNIIILLYPIFMNSDQNVLMFIEEPEFSLHPGMQRIFIDTILKKQFDKFQLFFTTHSNHFLDMTLDHGQISLFNFQKNQVNDSFEYLVQNIQNENIKLLDTLGVRNSSIFLSNCTVWVEGITDRLYLNKYIEVYQKSILKEQYAVERLKEDFHFSYVEYGGANIVHYSFDDEDNWEKIKASKICNKIILIMDEDGSSDKPDSKKFKRIQKLKEHLGDRLIVLPCREIENTLSAKIVRLTLESLEEGNIDILDFSEDEYKDEYMGTFIESKIKNSHRSYCDKSGSGTLTNKVAFCKTAIGHIKEINDLSDHCKLLAATIYDFIKSHNCD